jgi:Na+(H+)/acetate symporter ActP
MIIVFSLVAILIPICYSIYSSYKIRNQIKSSRDFFLFQEGLVPAKLRNSITASNASVASVIFAFLGLGYSFKIAAIISPITWLLGFLILIWVYPRIKNIKGKTLHGYLSMRYNNRSIGSIASIASIIGFLGTYGIELLVSIKITTFLF